MGPRIDALGLAPGYTELEPNAPGYTELEPNAPG
jgi:hypothetical protein